MRAPGGPLKIVLAFCAGAALFSWRSADVAAHDHVGRHVAWPGAHPVYDANEADYASGARDVTFLVRPIRVDLDAEAPGPHSLRAVRLHVRHLRLGGQEQTISWERPLFPSEEAFAAFKRRLEPLMHSPIVSLRARVILDRESPEWNKRWRATELPYWAEIPVY